MTDAKEPAGTLRVAQLLVAVGREDTAYRDVYLAAAAAQLEATCSPNDYAALRALEKQRDRSLLASREAVLASDWAGVDAAAAQAEAAQQRLAAQADAMALGGEVYDRPPLRLDPFSPGVAPLLEPGVEPVGTRQKLLERLTHLAQLDTSRAAFYASRRAYFAGLQVAEASPGQRASPVTVDPAQLRRQAYAAAQRGDASRLRELAQQIQRATAPQTSSASAPGGAAQPSAGAGRCPVDLTAAFPAAAVARAAALGLAAVQSPPALEGSLSAIEYAHVHAWQPTLGESGGESGGALRLQHDLTDAGVPAAVASQPLVAQLLRNTFVTSLGTRYLLNAGAESVLIEDFAEDDALPSGGPLLAALGLPQRTGLARSDIEAALQARGATFLDEQLGLDPIEYRLVCVPWDVYLRVGRTRGWGRQPHWTHFDGYQVLRNRNLRALVGGDTRYGGLVDLVSLSPTDARDGVVARVAVVRRARFVCRW